MPRERANDGLEGNVSSGSKDRLETTAEPRGDVGMFVGKQRTRKHREHRVGEASSEGGELNSCDEQQDPTIKRKKQC
jgi:hypothetical protein